MSRLFVSDRNCEEEFFIELEFRFSLIGIRPKTRAFIALLIKCPGQTSVTSAMKCAQTGQSRLFCLTKEFLRKLIRLRY